MKDNNKTTIVITIVKEKVVKKYKFILTIAKYNSILDDLENNCKYIKIGPLVFSKENMLTLEEI